MTKKMLIDAAHPEEIRVAVLDQNRVEDFDFESAARKPLRGNIYLARVTRVEPSLQAAFVEYGGNRHGFLAFSEIHPDYYQIPVADRERLQAAEAEVADLAAQLELSQRGDEDDEDGPADNDEVNGEDASEAPDDTETASAETADDTPAETANDDEQEDIKEAQAVEPAADDAPSSADTDEKEEEEEEEDVKEDGPEKKSSVAADADKPETQSADVPENQNDVDKEPSASTDTAETSQPETVEAANEDDASSEADDSDAAEDGAEDDITAETVEAASDDNEATDSEVSEDDEGDQGEDAGDEEETKSSRAARNALFERYKEAKRKRSNLLRNYKIQEVIKRRQILLIQVVKEERGNKGAALTTYLSLAGRYCVLMPNTARGGGISRKIPNGTDRRRLRRVVDSLEVPQGMGLIIRTAGAKRTKTEIKRDYEYLLRLWENIRTLTLKSIAPCLIYEEASLIKRAIRDLYDKDISKVMVEGEAGYREAKDFMKMLMPSHAKYVQPYKERAPIFLKTGVETQLDGMYQPSVRLKSGGYIVIHQTEALVAIDVNSGRATRERNIELTALKTNIEAAQEAARQFRLRDLAGLIVIDFIDMEEPKNNRKVEKALKEALKSDRARIQTGRISSFGLLEMSRQRRRSGIVDGTTHSCPTCSGAGVIRSLEMAALRILRAIEGEAISGKVGRIAVRASVDVGLHLLNHHRDWLKRIETDNGVSIEVIADSEKAGDEYDLEKSGAPRPVAETGQVVQADQTETIAAEEEPEVEAAEEEQEPEKEQEKDGVRKRRRRRRRKKDPSANGDDAQATEARSNADESDASDKTGDKDESQRAEATEDGDEEKPKRRRRRGRRGGRRNRQSSENGASENEGATSNSEGAETSTQSSDSAASKDQPQADAQETPSAQPVAKGAPPAVEPTTSENDGLVNGAADKSSTKDNADDHSAAPEPKTPEPKVQKATPAQEAEEPAAPVAAKPKKPARKGWWQRATGS